jgi:hypothetical protein
LHKKLGPDRNPGPFCLPLKPQKIIAVCQTGFMEFSIIKEYLLQSLTGRMKSSSAGYGRKKAQQGKLEMGNNRTQM